jgi:hypothetical protein
MEQREYDTGKNVSFFYTRKPTNGLDFHYSITENRVVQHRSSKVKEFKLENKTPPTASVRLGVSVEEKQKRPALN